MKLAQNSQAEVDSNIHEALGDANYATYQNFQQTLPQRGEVNQLAQKLSYTSEPLQNSQVEQLVSVLADTNKSAASAAAPDPQAGVNMGAIMGGMLGVGPGGPGGNQDLGVPITQDAINRASGFLSQTQIQALQDLQAAQAAQQKANDMRRAIFNNANNNNGSNATAGAATTPAANGRPRG